MGAGRDVDEVAARAGLAARQMHLQDATAAIDRVKERGAKEIRFVCLIAAQQGVERVRGLHPDVRLWTAAIDDRLDERGFIVPGLGDAGDRAYGTK
jgi:uracil phosphoribosyltransferase